MDALTATGVCRRYGEQEVLKDFSLTLGAGGFEALMGPSGSGKSTFLHLAAGLLAADAGSIVIGGTDVTRLTDSAAARFRRRHVGVVFQAFNLLNEKTVAENIVLPLRLDHARPDMARFEKLVGVLGLADKLQKKPEQLSGGERQRVAIARALMAGPDVVLADEPTGNLDVQAAKELCALLKELNATSPSAILVVTHDPVVAATATRVNFLKDGRIVAAHDTHGDAERVARLYLETFA